MLKIAIDKAKHYEQPDDMELLKNINIVLRYGDVLWVKGPTGCGKTTLLKILSGVIPFLEPCRYEGEIRLDGIPLSVNLVERCVSFCFQSAEYQFLFDNVRRHFLINQFEENKWEFIESTLATLNKKNILEKSIKDISSGERKLISILATLQKNRKLQIFDEPTANLDSSVTNTMLKLIESRSQPCITIIASHDSAVGSICNKVLFFDEIKREWLLNEKNILDASQYALKINLPTSKKIVDVETEPSIVCRKVGHKYLDGTRVFENISCHIKKGEVVGVFGKNGSGKTTFIKIISNVLRPNEGEVSVNKASHCGIVLQENEKQLFGFTVWDEILLGLKRNAKTYQEAEQLLRQLNLYLLRDHSPFFLSRGQKQLLLIGSILIHRPEIIIFDEPFSGLDSNSTNKAINLIFEFHRQYQPTIIISDQDDILIKDLLDKSFYFPQIK